MEPNIYIVRGTYTTEVTIQPRNADGNDAEPFKVADVLESLGVEVDEALRGKQASIVVLANHKVKNMSEQDIRDLVLDAYKKVHNDETDRSDNATTEAQSAAG